MKELKQNENLYNYILNLSTFDINELIEKADTEEEKNFYLKLEELKTQILQEKLIAKGVY